MAFQRNTLISDAFRKIGALGDFESLTSAQTLAGARAVRTFANHLINKGEIIFAQVDVNIPLSVFTTNTVSIGPSQTINQPRPFKMLNVQRRDNLSKTSIDLQTESILDYKDLTNFDVVGTPIAYTYKPLVNSGSISLWPRPDSYWTANGELNLVYDSQIQDIPDTAPDVTINMPDNWELAMVYNIAYILAPEYGFGQMDRAELRAQSKEMLDEVLAYEVEEASAFIRPDVRSFK
ncbi:hypothetical protein [Microcystis sp. M42BS1]|uniref:phage adaptor protein n=1 Tax=Microcystis sp. M42BS1 TaxID=2771192 RepID=UPI00258BF984|nr:hypothetical protein [Microcystis sp. M42BS1]MCA2570709.1 hypothetical protein [Microcystis sp. M42BS1]